MSVEKRKTIIFWQIIEIPAVFFLGFWFIMQFFSGAASLTATVGT